MFLRVPQSTTGWSAWSSSTFLPSLSPLSTCSSPTCSARSHLLKTTLSPHRSMLPFWGEGRWTQVKPNCTHTKTHTCMDSLWLLFRSIFLKLASLGIYLFFVFDQTKNQPVSWERFVFQHPTDFDDTSSAKSSLEILIFFICVLLFQCRENIFGREMYKLSNFNFLATLCNAFLFSYPRK